MTGLYRGKTKDGKVVEGYYCYYLKEGHYIFTKAKSFLGGFIKVLPQSIAQKTGVKDKNKKDIYGSIEIEGKMTEGGDKCNAGNLDFTVEWLEGHLCWVSRFGDTQYSPLYMVRGNAENLEIIPQEAE